jgi:hypothetical protein
VLTALGCGTWRGGLWCRPVFWGMAARMGSGPRASHVAVRRTFHCFFAMSFASDARAPLGNRPRSLMAGRAGHAAKGEYCSCGFAHCAGAVSRHVFVGKITGLVEL